MSERKFSLVSERVLGTLNADQKKVWKTIRRRANRLEATERKLEEDLELFFNSVTAEMVLDNHPAVEGLSVREDGTVAQTYCECYRCQSKLQNLPATQVVEAMVKMQLIQPENVIEARRWAAAAERAFGVPRVN